MKHAITGSSSNLIINSKQAKEIVLVPNHAVLTQYLANTMVADEDGDVQVAPPVFIFSRWVESLVVRLRMLAGRDIPESLDSLAGLLAWAESASGQFEQTGRAFELAAARQARDADRYIRQWLGDDETPYLEEQFYAVQKSTHRKLRKKGLFSTEDWIQDLAEQLEADADSTITLPSRIDLAGFIEFTAQESALLDRIEDRGVQIRRHVKTRAASNVRVLECHTPDDEWQAAVAWAKSQLDEGAQRLAIVMPDGSATHGNDARRIRDLLCAVFHPEEAARLDDRSIRDFYIPDAFSLADSPTAENAIILLRITLAGLETKIEFPVISHWLLSRNWLDSEFLARARLEIRLRELGIYEISLNEVRRLAASDEFGESLEGLCRLISDLPDFLPDSFQGYGSFFYEALGHWGWPGSFADPSTGSAADEFVGLLERLDPMDIQSTQKALETLQMMVAETRRSFGGGPLSPVQVLGPEVAVAGIFDGVWVIGMDNANWPPPISGNPYLPAMVRTRMPRMNPEGQHAYYHELTHRLGECGEHVIFSWSRDGGQGERNLSGLVPAGQSGKVEPEDSTNLATVFWEGRSLSGEQEHCVVADPDGSNGLPISDSEVAHLPGGSGFFRLQAACPMLGYLRYRLKADFPAPPSALATPQFRGELMHHALHELYRQTVETGVVPLTTDISVSVEAALIRLRARERLTASGLLAERQRLKNLLREWLSLDNARGGFAVEAIEAASRVDCNGSEISIRMDRLDRMTDGSFFVLDYKSGGATSKALKWILPRLQEPQLPLYAVLLEEQGDSGRAGGIAFAVVRKGQCAFDGISGVTDGDAVKGFRKPGSWRLKGWDWQELMDHWRSQIGVFHTEILEGRADNRVYEPLIVEQSGLDLILRYSREVPDEEPGVDDAF